MGQYFNGVEHGSYRSFYENGRIENEGVYKNGLLDGDFIVRYPTGEIKSRGKYSDGKKNGPWVEYYVSGALSRKGFFKMGAIDGVVTGWKGQGGLEVEMLDSEGTGILREWHENGVIKSEAIYVKGFLNGLASNYLSNSGALESTTVYLNGKEIGPRRFFDEDGKVIKEYFPDK
jgi:antitoxin component YwqK of YwqJK toxin-antitoxin module